LKINIAIIFLLIFQVLIFCQEGNQIVKELQEKFESIENFSADFLQSSELPEVKKPVIYKGKFLFEKENKYRIELKNSEIITDGNTIWNYNKKVKKVIISSAENDQEIFSVKSIIYDYPAQSKIIYVGKEQVNGDSCNVIQLNPVGKEVKFESAILWIGVNNLIKKFEVKSPDKSDIIFELSNIKINQKISNDKFVFNPPQGTEIIDLR
jgi:outer membrane lipoprotein carrier protein